MIKEQNTDIRQYRNKFNILSNLVWRLAVFCSRRFQIVRVSRNRLDSRRNDWRSNVFLTLDGQAFRLAEEFYRCIDEG